MSAMAKSKKKKTFKRNFDLRRIKRDMSYSPLEISDVLGVHKNTIHHWLKEGLPKLDNQKPYLIHGHELYAFLQQRKQIKRKKCQANEIYCVKCKLPREVWENVVDLIIYNDKQLMIQGLCAICANKVNKLGTTKQINNYKKQFVVQEQRQLRIDDTSKPSSICDKKRTD